MISDKELNHLPSHVYNHNLSHNQPSHLPSSSYLSHNQPSHHLKNQLRNGRWMVWLKEMQGENRLNISKLSDEIKWDQMRDGKRSNEMVDNNISHLSSFISLNQVQKMVVEIIHLRVYIVVEMMRWKNNHHVSLSLLNLNKSSTSWLWDDLIYQPNQKKDKISTILSYFINQLPSQNDEIKRMFNEDETWW